MSQERRVDFICDHACKESKVKCKDGKWKMIYDCFNVQGLSSDWVKKKKKDG